MLDIIEICFCTVEFRWQQGEEAEAGAVVGVPMPQLLWKRSCRHKNEMMHAFMQHLQHEPAPPPPHHLFM